MPTDRPSVAVVPERHTLCSLPFWQAPQITRKSQFFEHTDMVFCFLQATSFMQLSQVSESSQHFKQAL
jgi:hypothetical protein